VLKARSSDVPTATGASGGGAGLFGGARPRELALKEAGRDSIKEDLALSRSAGAARRKKHADEKAIEDDVVSLKRDLEKATDETERGKILTTIGEAELALSKLTLELDDKVKFAQRDGNKGDRDRAFEKKDSDKKEGDELDAEKKPVRGGRPAERERDMDKGWGDGKSERQADRSERPDRRGDRGGRGGDRGDRENRGVKKEEEKKPDRAPRAPKTLVPSSGPEAVKIAASGFAALAMDDDA
jgi:TAG lipase/steryl ester hydrolase/phospholipase A2/LPA acyltransferase|tara:strand:+ start:291 stop:1016 length:726 start_codon:yes stop_codon:yes gene_type:complete